MILVNIFNSGGLWLLPLGLLIATILLIRSGLKSWKSGSESLPSTDNPSGTDYGSARAHWYQIWQFDFAIITGAAFIVSLISIINSYQGV